MSADEDSTTFLGNLFQCLTTLPVKKYFLVFRWFLISAHSLFFCQWVLLRTVWLLLHSLPAVQCFYILIITILQLSEGEGDNTAFSI